MWSFSQPLPMAAVFDKKIDGFYGAPQSVSSHQFIDRGEDEIGFFMETAPTHPILTATAASNFGAIQQEFMSKLNHTSFLIALARDGVIDGDEGGKVSLHPDGRIKIEYPTSPKICETFKAAHKSLVELGLAGGAKSVHTLHINPVQISSINDIEILENQKYGLLEHGIFSAHQMGGLTMGGDPEFSIVNSRFQHHQINNLFVVDGSVFPTSLGVNPSLTIYGLAHKASEYIIEAL